MCQRNVLQACWGVVALNGEPDATAAATRRLLPLDTSMRWHDDVGGVDVWSVSILRLTARDSYEHHRHHSLVFKKQNENLITVVLFLLLDISYTLHA